MWYNKNWRLYSSLCCGNSEIEQWSSSNPHKNRPVYVPFVLQQDSSLPVCILGGSTEGIV